MSEWTWILGAVLSGIILYLIPRRLIRLHREAQLSERRFALTLSTGWSFAIAVFYYVSLVGIIIERRDPLLTALGLLIAGLNFTVGYPIARLFHKYIFMPLLDRTRDD